MSDQDAGRADSRGLAAGSRVETVAALPEGRIVAGCDDGRVLLWDLSAVDHGPAELGRHDSKVCAIEVLADGRVISGSEDGWVQIWRPGAPGCGVVVWPGPSIDRGVEYPRYAGPAVQAMAALTDGRVALVKNTGEVLLWDPQAAPGALAAWHRLGSGDFLALAVAELPDGRVVTGCTDGRVLVWDLAVPPPRVDIPRRPRLDGRPEEPPRPEPRQYFELGRHGKDAVWTMAGLADGRVITGGYDGRVLLWDPADPGHGPGELGRHKGFVSALAALPDGRIASGGKDGRVFLCDPATSFIEFARFGTGVIALAAVSRQQSEPCLVIAYQGDELSVRPVTSLATST